MQDSLEDYIKISKNCNQETVNKQIHISTQRQKECDIRAMKIVEFSIEGKLRPEVFTRCLPFINQSHYQDIVEERAITKLCGYSICGKKIPEMPKKQYYISTRNNKIYDITDRKNYCCNFCYKASLHIKNQIDDSPLWLRKPEDIPEYRLMESSEGGLPGEYIDQGVEKAVVEPAFISVNVFTDVSLTEIAGNEKVKEKINKVKGSNYRKSSRLLKTMQTITENSEQVDEEEISEEKPSTVNKKTSKIICKKLEHSNSINMLPVIDENEEKLEVKPDVDENVKNNSEPVKVNSKKSKKKGTKSSKVDIEFLVTKAVKEWLSVESLIFIHGESKVKEVLNEKKLSDYFEQFNITELQRDQQMKYMNICKRLQLQEMADDKFDNALIGNTKLQPLPDYKKLKEENRDLNVKVKCFYSGVLQEKEDTNFPTSVSNKNDTKDEEGPPAVLPLIDAKSQNAMRRKIFLTSINKSMQQLLQAFKATNLTWVLSDLQTLVRTFNLKADNIVFKPVIWNYIAITLLNILSVHDGNVKSILEEEQNQMYIELQLSSLPSKNKFLSHIMELVENIELFVETYISSK